VWKPPGPPSSYGDTKEIKPNGREGMVPEDLTEGVRIRKIFVLGRKNARL